MIYAEAHTFYIIISDCQEIFRKTCILQQTPGHIQIVQNIIKTYIHWYEIYFIGPWFLFSKTKWPSLYLSYHLIKPLTSSQSLDKHLALHQRISGGATTGETQSELTSDYLDQDNWCVPRQNDCINWGKGNWFPPPLGHRSLLWMLGLMFPNLVTPDPPLSCHPRVLLGKDSAQLNIIR